MKLLKELKKLHNKEVEKLGIILKGDKIVELDNIHDEPENGALMRSSDVFEYLYSGKHKVIATWHTHVSDSASLSGEDYATFMMHPELEHYIISETEVKRYFVEGGSVRNG